MLPHRRLHMYIKLYINVCRHSYTSTSLQIEINISCSRNVHINCKRTCVHTETCVRIIDQGTVTRTHVCGRDRGRKVRAKKNLGSLVAQRREREGRRGRGGGAPQKKKIENFGFFCCPPPPLLFSFFFAAPPPLSEGHVRAASHIHHQRRQ